MNTEEVNNEDYYQQIAHLYDIMYNPGSGIDHQAQVAWVERWRSKLELPMMVLDLACGTGCHLAEFERMGYTCFGVDASEEMLRIAADRLTATELQQMHFKDFTARESLPLITCFFNSMAYNKTKIEFCDILRRIRSVLQPGGLFVFDMVCTEEPKAAFIVKTFEQGDLKFSRTFAGVPTDRGYESLMCLVVLDGTETKVIQAKTLRGIYGPEDVRSMLLNEGFEVLYLGEGYSTANSTVFAARSSATV